MKELSIEEKAKRYDEAIERAKEFKNNPFAGYDGTDLISALFPELKESEDENRKWILEYLYDGLRKSNEQFKDEFKCAIAWLEKQGEKDKFIEKELGCIKGYRENAIKRLEELEKQSKDSPVLSDSSNIGKSVWSEEDDDNMIMIEDRLSDYFDYIREDSTLSKNQKKSLKEEIIRNVNWLKSLKDRVQPQPKQEWSEEDERLFQIVIDILDRENHLGNISHTDLIACVKKLKSLRPQSLWKPSNEQIEALDFAVDCIVWDKRKVLKELLEQLKKL